MNPIQTLTEINLEDLVDSFGWQDRPVLARILRRLFIRPARRFAEIMMEYDAAIAECGLAEASHLTLRSYVRELRVFGRDRIPDSAFLALSNHPGMVDTLSLFTALNRPNLKIVALDRPFLNAVPNLSKQVFYVKSDAAARMSMVRQVTSHLKAGGAALTFPAGHIEPDPDVRTGAIESLRSWTESVGVFTRMAPETAVLPMLVSGVIWERAMRHPLLMIKKTKEEKEKLAAAVQLLAHISYGVQLATVCVQIGKPIYSRDLGITDPSAIHQAVLSEMARLIASPPEGAGVNVL